MPADRALSLPWVVSGRGGGRCGRRRGGWRSGCAAAAWVLRLRPTWGGRWRRPGRCSSTGRWCWPRTRTGSPAGLAAVAAGEPAADVITGAAGPDGAGQVVFVFAGQGGQWAGMAAELAESCPVFAARLAECAAALAPQVDWPVAEVLAGRGGSPGCWTGPMWCSRCCGR